MDKILIKNARFLCNVGITGEERATKQEIFVDLELYTDIKRAAATDNLFETIDYYEVHDYIKENIEKSSFMLIESMAESVAQWVLGNFNVKKMLVRIKKPGALAQKNVEYAAVEIERTKKIF